MTNPFASTKEGGGRNLQGLLLTGGAGAGAMFAYFLVEVLKSKPEAVLTILTQWGPLFVIVLGGMFMANTWGQKLVDGITSNAQAQQQMADAMQQIAKRDDYAARERELLLNDMAFVLKEVRQEVRDIRQQQLAAAGREN